MIVHEKRSVLLMVGALALAGCVDQHPSPGAGKIASLQLDMVDPPINGLGTPAAPITAQKAIFNILAIDDAGKVFGGDADVDVYISFGGVKTGANAKCGADATGSVPISRVHLTGGTLMNQSVDLPAAFGATAIWLDENLSHATGASPTIYFRNPHITDVQTPPDLTASNATFCSPFNGKFIIVDQANAMGQLVVTSVFGNAFAVTDTGDTKFNSIYLFAFGKPPTYIVEGKVLKSFSGNVSKFVGFTELNFPLFQATDEGTPLAPVPQAFPLTLASITNKDNITLLGQAGGVVVYTGKVCNPSPPNPTHDANIQKTIDSWTKFNQFVIDGNGACSALTNYAVELPAKVLGSFDPLMEVGKTITVRGMLRNNSGQNPVLDPMGMSISCNANLPCNVGTCIEGLCLKGAFNFWTVVPRRAQDVCVPDNDPNHYCPVN